MAQAQTINDGTWNIPDLAPGNYNITVTMDGYQQGTTTATITNADVTVPEITLTKNA